MDAGRFLHVLDRVRLELEKDRKDHYTLAEDARDYGPAAANKTLVNVIDVLANEIRKDSTEKWAFRDPWWFLDRYKRNPALGPVVRGLQKDGTYKAVELWPEPRAMTMAGDCYTAWICVRASVGVGSGTPDRWIESGVVHGATGLAMLERGETCLRETLLQQAWVNVVDREKETLRPVQAWIVPARLLWDEVLPPPNFRLGATLP